MSQSSRSVWTLGERAAELRLQVDALTESYEQATAEHKFAGAIHLLRERTLLLRELLECRCELLLAIRAEAQASESIAPVTDLFSGRQVLE